jgi:hypothetical protein
MNRTTVLFLCWLAFAVLSVIVVADILRVLVR